MKKELTKLEADLIVYALIHVKDSYDNGEFKSSYIPAHKNTLECLTRHVFETLKNEIGELKDGEWQNGTN